MLITDAQVHIWEVDRPQRPWPPGRNEPHRPDGWSAEQMLAEMDSAGVDRAVIVPPTWVGEGNESALEAAVRFPERFAVMGRFDVEARDAADRLEGWLKQPRMLGIRMTFGWAPKIERLDDGSLDWYWGQCERLRIPLMLNVPGMAGKAGAIAQRHPGLPIIIDHMGVPHGEGPGPFADLDSLLALADFPNVRVKVSCVPNYSAEPYPYADIQPFLRRIYDSFGASRLLWGADITRLKGTYAACLGLFQEGLGYLSAADREWILGKSLASVLRWPEGID
jgi:predicted TIM-barrel fold metal-dependent hydrolase